MDRPAALSARRDPHVASQAVKWADDSCPNSASHVLPVGAAELRQQIRKYVVGARPRRADEAAACAISSPSQARPAHVWRRFGCVGVRPGRAGSRATRSQHFGVPSTIYGQPFNTGAPARVRGGRDGATGLVGMRAFPAACDACGGPQDGRGGHREGDNHADTDGWT